MSRPLANRFLAAFHLDEGWRGVLLRTDWITPVVMLILCGYGCAVIRSATMNSVTSYWSQQLLYFGIGWCVYTVLAMMDYERILRHAPQVYYVGVALLVPLAICAILKKDMGAFIKSVNGARRWMDLGPLKIQPSEFAKVTTLIMLAKVMSTVRTWDFAANRRAWAAAPKRGQIAALLGDLGWLTALPQVRVAAVAVLPIGLIFVQPDLKSCIVYLPMLAALLYVSRISLRFFVAVGLSAVLVAGVVGADMVGYARHVETYVEAHPESRNPGAEVRGEYQKESPLFLLKDYQRERILSFVRPDLIDPKGTGTSWNVKQAIIASGRGGLTGAGWLHGLQATLGYLPELAAHNDFVFSVFAEEFGFVGCLCLLVAYAFLIGGALRTAARARDRFGAFICVGVAAVFTVHVVVNIGMNIGLMPVSGLPLPFLSYGGSFVLSCFLLLGLVQSVHRYSRELPPRAGSGSDISTNALKDMRRTSARPA